MSFNKKKYGTFVATAATVTLVATAITPTASAAYKDATSHYKDAVNYVTSEGIAGGYSSSLFGVHDTITRGDAAVMIANALGINEGNAPKSLFKDLNSRVKNAVNALHAAGVVDGKSKTTFAPDDKITRAEIAKILANAYELNGEGVESKFTDVNTQFSPYVNALLKNGITQGKTATHFGATQLVTRGEFALFVYRLKDIQVVDEQFELSIMHFNDTHAHLDNAAKRVTAVNEIRAQKPSALLLDAGDVFSGTLYFNEFLGQADVKFMNLMKVDAMTFGNHEFDLGSSKDGHKALVDFIKAAQFPFVSSNVDFSKDELFTGLFNTKISEAAEGGNIYSGIVKEVDGEKVGIFGLTTADTKDIASPEKVKFTDYIEEAKKMVAEFEKMGINKIVAITHIGYDDNPAVDNDVELAKAVEGIDIIVGGHSHTALKEPVLIETNTAPTIIVQAGQYAESLGTLDVTFNGDGVVVEHQGELIKIADKVENPEAKKMLEEYSTKIAEVKNEPTGATAVKALENPRGSENSVRSNETPLGNLITDGMLIKAKEYNDKVVMAFQNGGGIREAINQGPITVGEVISVLPFGNTLATMELTGAEIKAAFETSFRDSPLENGGFLHVSGAKVTYDSSKPTGERVISIAYKNATGSYTDIQDAEKYTIATNAFTAKGGDGYDVFKNAYEAGRVTDLGLSDWENLRDHIAKLITVEPKVEDRIVDVR